MQSSQVAKWLLRRFVFLIPAESGEKITLGISTMLNMTVFLMTVMQGLPATDQTPILSMYYATVMVLTTAATVKNVPFLNGSEVRQKFIGTIVRVLVRHLRAYSGIKH